MASKRENGTADNHVLIVTQPGSYLSEMLRVHLEKAGYAVAFCSDIPEALSTLHAATAPSVVILTHTDPAEQWNQLLADALELPSQAYLVLGAQQENGLSRWTLHTRMLPPMVPMAAERNEWSAQVVKAVAAVGRLEGILSHMLRVDHV